MYTSRRRFLQATMGLAAGWTLCPAIRAQAAPQAKKIPIALQLYSVRGDFTRDVPGTLKAVSKLGYEGVEPWGYAGTPKVFQEYSAKQLRKMLDDNGLKCCGMHHQLEALAPERLARYHREQPDPRQPLRDRSRRPAADGLGRRHPGLRQAAERDGQETPGGEDAGGLPLPSLRLRQDPRAFPLGYALQPGRSGSHHAVGRGQLPCRQGRPARHVAEVPRPHALDSYQGTSGKNVRQQVLPGGLRPLRDELQDASGTSSRWAAPMAPAWRSPARRWRICAAWASNAQPNPRGGEEWPRRKS